MDHAKPIILLVGGIMASGKSTVGERFIARLKQLGTNGRFLDIDDVAKTGLETLGKPLIGTPLWRTFLREYKAHLKQREPGVFVGCFREWHKRKRLMTLAHQAGYRAMGIFFDYQPEHVIPRAVQRAEETSNTHLLKGKDAAELIRDWRARFDAEQHPDLEKQDWLVIHDPHISSKSLVEFVLSKLSV